MNPARELERAEGFLLLGMLADAERALDGVQPDPTDRLRWLQLRTELASRQGQWAAMRRHAASWAMLCPGDAAAAVSLAFATRRHESIHAARRILLDAERLHPKHALIGYNLACYAAVAGDLEEARTRIRSVLAIDASFREVALGDDDLAPLRDWIAALPAGPE